MFSITSKHFWQVFFTKLAFNLKSEVSKTYLGYAWWLLEPVFFVTALYVVFGIFLHTRTENFILFLVCGMIPYSWFSRSVGNSSQSILQGRGLINQIAIPKAFFPLLTVSQDLVKQAVVFVAMLGFILAMGETASIHWLALIPIAFVQFMFIIAIAFFAAAIVPVIPDFRFLIGTALTIGMWGSGIFYSYTQVLLLKHQQLFLMNPMANLIKNYRQVLLDNQWPDWVALSWIAGISIALIAFMLFIFKRHDTTYARLVIQ